MDKILIEMKKLKDEYFKVFGEDPVTDSSEFEIPFRDQIITALKDGIKISTGVKRRIY